MPHEKVGEGPSAARGWIAVSSAAIILAAGAGVGFYALSAYSNAFVDAGRFKVFELSNASTVFMLSSGLAGVPLSKLLDRVEPRVILAGGGLVGGLALASIGQVTTLWQLYLAYLVAGLGIGATAVVPTTAVIVRWFPVHPVRPLAVAGSGLSVGGAVIAPVVASLLDHRGLAGVMAAIGAVFGVLAIVLSVLFMRSPNAWAHSRDTGAGLDPPAHRAGDATARSGPPPARAELLTRRFLLVCVAFSLLMLAQVSVITHLLTIASEQHIDHAATGLVVIAGTSIVGRVVALPILGRVSSLSFGVAMALTQAAGVVVLSLTETRPMLLAGTVLMGVAVGNNVVLLPACLHELYSVSSLTYLFSWANLATYVGTGGGPAILGLGFTLAGSYRVPLLAIAAGSVAAGLILATVRRSSRDVLGQQVPSPKPDRQPSLPIVESEG